MARDLAEMVRDFEQAAPISRHGAHRDYLDNLEALCLRMAQLTHQDAEISAAWLSKRRPRKGRRVPWRERITLARRIRAHGRQGARAWAETARAVRAWRSIHEEFVAKEQAQAQQGLPGRKTP